MSDTKIIGMGEYIVINNGTRISTLSLGSCVGTVIYDEIGKISAMSHIMLPTMGEKQGKIGKYADAALPAMIQEMKEKGAVKSRLKAKIAGGASLFTFKDDYLKIGKRNTEAVERILSEEKIRVVSKDVGGNHARTITFDPGTKELIIKMIKKESGMIEEKII